MFIQLLSGIKVMLVFPWFLILEKMVDGGQDGDHDWWRHRPPGKSGGGGGVTLRVRPRVKNSRTPDHQLICLTKSSLALFTPCPLPDGGKLSLWRKLWAIVDYLRVQWPGHSHREKETKLWWKKFKIKRFVSCCDETWDFRSIEGKDKLSADPLTAI